MVYPRWLTATLSILFGVVCFAVLQGAVALGGLSSYVVPPPSDMVAAIPSLFLYEGLAGKFLITFATTFAATSLSILIGVPFGWFLFRKPGFGKAYESWLGAAFSAPLILLYPLFMVIFGRGVPTVLAMGVVAGVLPITLSALQGLRGIPAVYLNVAYSFGMSERQIATKVLLPAALPSIFTGIRLGLIYTMIYIVAVEFLANTGGLGFLVNDLNNRYNIPGMYGAVIFVVLVSVLFFVGTERVERWLKSL